MTLAAVEYRAGIARIKITPDKPIWLSGYASRTRPSEGVAADLWAKALAIEDAKGNRIVIVTADVIGLPRSITDPVAARTGLDRSRLVFNSSHTHSGPVLQGNLTAMYDLSPEDLARVRAYSVKLADDLFTVIGAALGDLQPAVLSYAEGSAYFAVNRREPTPKGIRIGVNPEGPRDTAVPVLKVAAPDGTLRAVLFGYACHNTTLGGDFYRISGDYAGFAQAEFEKTHPGVAALFLQLCGGDINPNPRGTLALAERHGRALAAEVDRVLSTRMQPVRGTIRSALQIVEPGFAHYTRETFENRLNHANAARARNARLHLKAMDEGRSIRRIQYPVQAVRFGKSLTLVALGGEVVVDYALRIKRDYRAAREPIIVAGYSNDVMCYIPSLAVLKEGGYEAMDSMDFYGMPGPFDETVEETIFRSLKSVLKRLGR